jgi:glycolate oxidase FAD binding subunit
LLQPTTVEDVQTAVRHHPHLRLRGAGSKPALSIPVKGETVLDLTGITGVLTYTPTEFTFTALAGTRVAEVQAMLAEHGQYLPFDPPLAGRCATLGGTVAAGLSGPGRYRYGGVRDFILGVRFVDGRGELVRGGGNVVKNSAGFDLPKLMVGSLGQMGALVELTFKVFPQSPAHITIQRPFGRLAEAVEALYRIYTARLDVAALDLALLVDGSADLQVRLGGLPEALPARAERIRTLLAGGEMITGEPEAAMWRDARDFVWVPAGWSLLKVPLTPRHIAGLEAALRAMPCRRRYSAGGNVAWIALPGDTSALTEALVGAGLSGLRLFGPPGPARVGARTGQLFARRVKTVLDPDNRFGET